MTRKLEDSSGVQDLLRVLSLLMCYACLARWTQQYRLASEAEIGEINPEVPVSADMVFYGSSIAATVQTIQAMLFLKNALYSWHTSWRVKVCAEVPFIAFLAVLSTSHLHKLALVVLSRHYHSSLGEDSGVLYVRPDSVVLRIKDLEVLRNTPDSYMSHLSLTLFQCGVFLFFSHALYKTYRGGRAEEEPQRLALISKIKTTKIKKTSKFKKAKFTMRYIKSRNMSST